VKSTLTAGTDVREKVIQYFAEAVNKNEKRAQMQVNFFFLKKKILI